MLFRSSLALSVLTLVSLVSLVLSLVLDLPDGLAEILVTCLLELVLVDVCLVEPLGAALALAPDLVDFCDMKLLSNKKSL